MPEDTQDIKQQQDQNGKPASDKSNVSDMPPEQREMYVKNQQRALKNSLELPNPFKFNLDLHQNNSPSPAANQTSNQPGSKISLSVTYERYIGLPAKDYTPEDINNFTALIGREFNKLNKLGINNVTLYLNTSPNGPEKYFQAQFLAGSNELKLPGNNNKLSAFVGLGFYADPAQKPTPRGSVGINADFNGKVEAGFFYEGNLIAEEKFPFINGKITFNLPKSSFANLSPFVTAEYTNFPYQSAPLVGVGVKKGNLSFSFKCNGFTSNPFCVLGTTFKFP